MIADPSSLKSAEIVFLTSRIFPKTEMQSTGGILITVPSFPRYVLDKLSLPEMYGIPNASAMSTHASTERSSAPNSCSSGYGQIKLSISRASLGSRPQRQSLLMLQSPPRHSPNTDQCDSISGSVRG